LEDGADVDELFLKHAVTVCALCFNVIRFKCE
jgi:hypothetical protein